MKARHSALNIRIICVWHKHPLGAAVVTARWSFEVSVSDGCFVFFFTTLETAAFKSLQGCFSLSHMWSQLSEVRSSNLK